MTEKMEKNSNGKKIVLIIALLCAVYVIAQCCSNVGKMNKGGSGITLKEYKHSSDSQTIINGQIVDVKD